MKPKTVVAIAGLPLSGKSTLGKALSQALGIHFVDIDEGPCSCAPPQEPNPYRSEEARSLRRAQMTVAYSVLHAAITANLEQGFSVIISATYSRHNNQDFLAAATKKGGGTLKVILCQFNDTPEEIEKRVNDRLSRGAIEGCRSVEHYLDDKAKYAGIKLPHLVVMMNGGQKGLDKAVREALAYINGG